MMTYLGLTVGPSLGGWLTLQFGWRAAFFINLPIGLLAIWLSIYFIPRDAPADQPEPFDWAGAATFMIGLVVLMLALNQGHAWGWTSPIILTMLFVAPLIAALFAVIEQRMASPMLDLSLFRQRLFSAAAASAGGELHLYVQRFVFDAVLPHPSARFRSRASRCASHRAAAADGAQRATQRHPL
jgi:MFS family permease